MRKRSGLIIGFTVLALLVLIAVNYSFNLDAQVTPIVERVSIGNGDEESDNTSTRNDISADGRYVVFASYASNLVDGDTNNYKDIFIRDRVDGTTTRVSVATGGAQGNGNSDAPRISADGTLIVFESLATNLVASDTNAKSDLFLRDWVNDTTTRISVATAGTQANDHSFYPDISSDGRYVVFQSAASNLVASDTNNVRDIFIRDTVGDTTERVSVDTAEAEADNDSMQPAVSQDGRFVAFTSMATNLVAGDNNGVTDIFLRDRTLTTTIRVSVDSVGVEADAGSAFPAIDDDGSYIAYESVATNLVQNDTNNMRDIFAYQRLTGETRRVSVATDGTEADNTSGDGVDEQSVNISADGQYVVFKSRATNLVAGDTNGVVDVFVHHQRESFITSRISVNNYGVEGNSYSYYPSISSDGQFIAYYSYSSNLVTGDANGFGDVFVYNRDAAAAPTPTVTSVPSPSTSPSPPVTISPIPVTNPVVVGIPLNTSTPTQIDVATTAGTATIRCERVTQGGSVTILVLNTPPGQLQSYMRILKTNFDISAVDLTCDLITVCLPYSETEVSEALLTEQNLRLFHYINGAWADVTTYIDTAANRMCGRAAGFSPFVIGVSTATPTPTGALPATTVTPISGTPAPTQELPKSGSSVPTIGLLGLVLGFVLLGVLLIL